MENYNISFDIPAGKPITGFYGMSVTADDFIDLQSKKPAIFWIEQDLEGVDKLCMSGNIGCTIPTITYTDNNTSVEVKGRPFEVIMTCDKTEGDRSWHPTQKPARPVA